MINKHDWDETKRRFMEFWSRENHDRPLITLVSPKKGYISKPVSTPSSLFERWTDTGYIIEKSREAFNGTYYGGEAFPMLFPNLGPDFLGATLGCDLTFGDNTTWAHPVLESWKDFKGLSFDPENKWWKLMMKMTRDISQDAGDDYIVGLTDYHAGADALVALRGPENLCTDLYDDPEPVKKAVFDVWEIFREQISRQHAVISEKQQGSTTWMPVWHPGLWYVTSCDFIGMISNEMFKEFILPELREELAFFDASIFHLDGPAALRHLDTLLEIPELDGIQWVSGAGQPSAPHWIPVLKKIQDAGKLIQLGIFSEDLDPLLDNLKPEGVLYSCWCKTEDEAKSLLAKTEASRSKKFY